MSESPPSAPPPPLHAFVLCGVGGGAGGHRRTTPCMGEAVLLIPSPTALQCRPAWGQGVLLSVSQPFAPPPRSMEPCIAARKICASIQCLPPAFGQCLLLDLTRNDLQQVDSPGSKHTIVHAVQQILYCTPPPPLLYKLAQVICTYLHPLYIPESHRYCCSGNDDCAL